MYKVEAGVVFISKIDLVTLENLLLEIDNEFIPALSQRVNIIEYARKLSSNAVLFGAKDKKDGNLVGLIAIYCNDIRNRTAYIPIIGLVKKYRGKGYGQKLLELAIDHAKKLGFFHICLETWENSSSQKLYLEQGFRIDEIIEDRPNGIRSLKMKLSLKLNTSILNKNLSTPLQYFERLSKDLKINLFIKRDDLFPLTGGGNKARKLCYILNSDIKNNYNAIVTSGANQSNHLRATALNGAILGWKTICIIHDKEPINYNGNLKITNLTGAELRFVNKQEVSKTMNDAMVDLSKNGYKPLYIWGGGHCVEGSFAYYCAIKELRNQLGNVKPDFIFLASGTGTTQAGIEIGVRRFIPECKVIGISISRKSDYGKESIINSMKALNKTLNNPVSLTFNIDFDDKWIGDGYEKQYPELFETIEWASRKEGLILDPTYTGKAFHALVNYVKDGIIPKDSNVVFWHTGGLLNLLASENFKK